MQNILSVSFLVSIFTQQWLAQAAKYSGLKKHNDNNLSVIALSLALCRVFVNPRMQRGKANTITFYDMYKHYKAFDKMLWEKKQQKVSKEKRETYKTFSYQYFMKVINSEAFFNFVQRIFVRIFSIVKEQYQTNIPASTVLLKSLQVYLPDLTDIRAIDGCYKHVSKHLNTELKGRRNAKKIENENGEKVSAPNAQIGLQVTYSLCSNLPCYIDLSKGTANERDYVKLDKNTLTICDAGYCNYNLFNVAKSNHAWLMIKAKSNLKGTIKSIKINGVDETKTYKGKTLDSIKSTKPSEVLDMIVTVNHHNRPLDVRVIRAKDPHKKFCYVMTNLLSNIAPNIILNLMRLRWGIELYFKTLKSNTNYRAAISKYITTTKALCLISLTVNFMVNMFLKHIELRIKQCVSYHKVYDEILSYNDSPPERLLNLILYACFGYYQKFSKRVSVINNLLTHILSNKKQFVQTKQHITRQGRSMVHKIQKIVQQVINDVNEYNLNYDVTSLQESLSNDYIYILE